MESDWPTYSLKEAGVQLIDCDHKTPKAQESGLPYIGIPQMKEGNIDFDANPRLISQSDLVTWTRKAKPQTNDVILSRRCNSGETVHVASRTEFALGQNLVILRSVGERVFPPYLRWVVRSPQWWEEVGKYLNPGAIFESLKCADIPKFKVPFPPLPEQKRIAHILGTLDDKIELNRKMNATLEAMAQALFKSWFVDFDPVIDNALRDGNPIPEPLQQRAETRRKALANGTANREAAKPFPAAFLETESMGWIPEGWEVSTIGEECETVGGGTPSTKNPNFWDGGDYPWVTPKDFSALQDKVLLSSSRFLTEEGLSKVSSGLLPLGTVLMSSRAPVGYLAISQIETAINQGFIAMICNKRLPSEYILQWASSRMVDIKQVSSGSTFAEISKKAFRPFQVTVPSGNIVESYTNTTAPIYARITDNVAESETLSSLRDTLLPKLISGELRLDA
ncbi:MAG: type I restriction enzyme S subunit [Rubritalea sp.]|jgi:type I restriction enzyme S subunit